MILRHASPLDHEQRNAFSLEFIPLTHFIVDRKADTGLLGRYPEKLIRRDVLPYRKSLK